MKKEAFLQELREYLQILEDQEQQDILDEYAQHIDMKLQKGLSEEEAIRDFGSVQELAAEILEAYHVKPNYQKAKYRVKTPEFSKMTEEGKKALDEVGGFFKKKAAALGGGFRKMGVALENGCRWIGKKCKNFWKRLTGLFRRKRDVSEAETKGFAQKTCEVKQKERKSGAALKRSMKALGRGVKIMWNGSMTFCKWTLRLIWNTFWLFCSGTSGIFTMLALFGFGSMIVLRIQRYPLTGIVILCLGAILMCGSISGACFSLIRRKAAAGTAEQEEEDVFYE